MQDINEGLDSPKDKNSILHRPKLSQGGESEDMQSDNIPLLGSQNRQRNREGTISKPRVKRNSNDSEKIPGNV